jgi:GMP synthase (glutamine-hydrolysing)
MKRISIIINGPGISEVKTLYGQASDWIQKVLSKYNDVSIRVIKGYEMEDIDASEDSAWIIAGSAHSVYNDLPWIDYLKEKLHEIKKTGKPVLGICFGHQLIADAFGGEVVLNEKGWELGSCRVNLLESAKDSPLLSGLPVNLNAYQSHQDVVVKIPDGSTLLAENEMGIQSFVYNDTFFGVQFHPEFTKTVMGKYLSIRYKKGIIDRIPDVKECKYGSLILNNFLENIVK